MSGTDIIVRIANAGDMVYVETIKKEIEASAKIRETGICQRSSELLFQKIKEGNAIIAITSTGEWVGFCYIQSWSDDEFVSSCALIVSPEFRATGIAKIIKQQIFTLSRKKYPNAKIFGLTTSSAVMKINSQLGYKPVTYFEITKDSGFWESCKSCVNHEILINKEKKNCLCTAMLYESS